jgi:hypothetical protein
MRQSFRVAGASRTHLTPPAACDTAPDNGTATNAICCAMRGHPQVGFRRFMSTMAAVASALGPFGPGFSWRVHEKSSRQFLLMSARWRRRSPEGFRTTAEFDVSPNAGPDSNRDDDGSGRWKSVGGKLIHGRCNAMRGRATAAGEVSSTTQASGAGGTYSLGRRETVVDMNTATTRSSKSRAGMFIDGLREHFGRLKTSLRSAPALRGVDPPCAFPRSAIARDSPMMGRATQRKSVNEPTALQGSCQPASSARMHPRYQLAAESRLISTPISRHNHIAARNGADASPKRFAHGVHARSRADL